MSGAPQPPDITAATAPYFSRYHGAWIISRPGDVRAVLRDARFVVSAMHPGAIYADVAPADAVHRNAAHRNAAHTDAANAQRDVDVGSAFVAQPVRWWMETGAIQAFRPDDAQLHAFESALVIRMHQAAERMRAAGSAAGHPREGDLLADILRPWTRDVAARVLGIPRQLIEREAPHARTVFEAAAHATSAAPAGDSVDATLALCRALETQSSAARTRSDLTVQAWVALTETLPALVAGGLLAWSARERGKHREHADPIDLRGDDIIDELLILASPVRAVFRQAIAPLRVGDAQIGAGDRVILRLDLSHGSMAKHHGVHDARHDDRLSCPMAEPDARSLPGSMPLIFGDGPHRCVGAGLVRRLFSLAIQVLQASTSIRLARDADARARWLDGFAIRAVQWVPIDLRESL